jgi:hypothetical protein
MRMACRYFGSSPARGWLIRLGGVMLTALAALGVYQASLHATTWLNSACWWAPVDGANRTEWCSGDLSSPCTQADKWGCGGVCQFGLTKFFVVTCNTFKRYGYHYCSDYYPDLKCKELATKTTCLDFTGYCGESCNPLISCQVKNEVVDCQTLY